MFRARLILALANGRTYKAIKRELDTTARTIARWKQQFKESGIEGLEAKHDGSKPRTATPRVQAGCAGGCNRSRRTTARILAQARLQPHRLERYLASNDPDFETKAADIIGLYLEPPQHAAVFCVDEKTAIQALDRLESGPAAVAGRAERDGFEYYRHDTLSLYAALDVKTGKVHGKTAKRHTSDEFIAFVSDVLKRVRSAKEIHIVLDNLSAHKTKAVH